MSITIIYCIICFMLEVFTSYMANWVNVSIISRKPFKATTYSLMTGMAGWMILLIIGKLSDWNIYIMVCSVVGDALGDYIVASRKIKKPKTNGKVKQYYKRKTPFSNA